MSLILGAVCKACSVDLGSAFEKASLGINSSPSLTVSPTKSLPLSM